MNNGNGTITLTLAVDGQGNVTGAVNDVSQSVGRMASETRSASGRMASDMDNIGSSFGRMVAAFTTGNLITSAIEKTIELLQRLKGKVEDSARYAAHVDTLGVAMHAVGNNAGYTSAQMDEYEKSVKRMGITTEAARQTLTQTAGAEMDVTKAAQLARVAQDAGVIGTINSSEAYMRMVQGIRSGETEILKTIGINVSFERSYQKLADSLGVSTTALSEHQKVQARQNAVLEYGINISGVYEASMTSTGKMITSMSRYYDELKLKFGESFAPSLGILIDNTTHRLKELLHWAEENKGAIAEFAKNMATIVNAGVNTIAHPIDTLGKVLISPFVGGEEDIAEENRQAEVEKKYNEMMAKKTEADRMKKMAEARRIRDKAEADALSAKAAEAEINQYNQFVVAFNDKIRAIEAGDTTLSAHEREIQKVRGEYEKLIEQYPKERSELEALERYHVQETRKRQEQADAIKATSDEFKALWQVWEHTPAEGPLVIGRTGEEMKAELDLSRLSLEMKLSEIDAQEKFYQITTGQAAQERTSILAQQLQLETDIYNKITEEGAVGDLARQQQLQRIVQINEKLLEQQKILNDSTAIGGATSALQEYARAAADIGSQTKNLVADMFKGMEDALVSFARNGKFEFRALADSIINDMLRIAIKQQITGPLSNVNYAELIGRGGSMLRGLFGGSGSTPAVEDNGLDTGNGVTGGSSVVAAGGGGGGSGSNWTSYLGGLGGGVGIAATVLYKMGQSYFGSGGTWNKHDSEQKYTMGGFNSIGAGVPMLLDYFTKGGLMGTAWKTTGAGVELGLNNGQLSAQQYLDQNRKKSWWRGTETAPTAYTDLDSQWSDFVARQYEGIRNAIKNQGSTIGMTITDEMLDAVNVEKIKIDMHGKSAEEQQKAIEAGFRDLNNQMIEKANPAIVNMERLGEDAVAAMERLTNLKLTNNALQMQILEAQNLQKTSEYMGLVNVQREHELVGLDASTQALQRYLWALQDQKKAVEDIYNAAGGKENLLIRSLRATGNDAEASLRELMANHYKERRDAEQSGLVDLAELDKVQTLERNKLISDIQTQANNNMLAAQQNYADQMTSIAREMENSVKISALNMIKELRTGPLSGLSPEAAYRQAQGLFATSSNASDIKMFVEASRAYNGSGPGFQSDLQAALNKLGALAGIGDNPTLDLAQKQLDQLEMIRQSTENTTSAVMSLAAMKDAQQAAAVAAALPSVAAAVTSTQAATTATAAAAVDYDAAMAAKAGGIAQSVMNYAVGLTSTSDSRWDLTKDGIINIGDAVVWQQIASGARKWSSLGLPAFAMGGDFNGGLRIVGEFGPELEATGRSRIFNADQTRNILSSGSADNREMVDELKAIKSELADVKRQLVAKLTDIESPLRRVVNK